MPFYAVAVGHKPGIYDSWEACCQQVYKFKSAKHKKFKTREEAERFIIDNKPGAKPNSKSISRSITTRKLSASFFTGAPAPMFNAHSPAASLESVIFDKITPKSSSRGRLSRVVSEETIILSDDELPSSPVVKPAPSRQPKNDHSVILLDDEDSLPPPIETRFETRSNNRGKQQKSDNAIIRTSQRRATTRSATRNSTTPNNRNPLPGDSPPGNNCPPPATSTPATSTPAIIAVRTPLRSGRSQIKLNLKTRTNNENQSRNEKNNAPRSKGHVVVYTDGACSNNGHANAKAGIGVWWGENDPRNISEPLTGRPTNNRAEIWAAVKAINQAADEGYDSITVCSDRYAI